MSYAGRALIGMSVAMMFSSPATSAQGVVMQRNLSLTIAKTIAEATSRNASRKASTRRPPWSTGPARCW